MQASLGDCLPAVKPVCWKGGPETTVRMLSLAAGVAELADAPDLGSGGETRAGSIPVARTAVGGSVAKAIRDEERHLDLLLVVEPRIDRRAVGLQQIAFG